MKNIITKTYFKNYQQTFIDDFNLMVANIVDELQIAENYTPEEYEKLYEDTYNHVATLVIRTAACKLID